MHPYLSVSHKDGTLSIETKSNYAFGEIDCQIQSKYTFKPTQIIIPVNMLVHA